MATSAGLTDSASMRKEAELFNEDDRSETIRSIGTGFGSLAGACILFLSVLASQGRPDLAQRLAIGSFATALPLLVFTTVAAYSLSLLRGTNWRTNHTRRALGATILFGLVGAVGVVLGLAALLWRLVPIAAISFVSCALVALVIYSIFTRLVTPPHKRM